MSKIFIPAQKITFLQKEFKKIERKAIKLGMEPPVLSINEDVFEIREVIQENYRERVKQKIRFVEVEVSGRLPVYNGWNLVASIEHSRLVQDEISYNTVRMNPNFPENIEYRTLPSQCKHCGHNRYRKNTYILFNTETKQNIQVGSTCIKDFLGQENPELIVSSASYIDLLTKFITDFEGGNYGFLATEFPIEDILKITSSEIRLNGWKSRGEVWATGIGPATAENVSNIFIKPTNHYSPSEKEVAESVNEYDISIAKGAIEWLKSFDLNDPKINNYIYNSVLCVKKERLETKDFGLACSIVNTYKRKLAKELEAKAPKQISEFVGKEKERLKGLELIYVNSWAFDSSWGVVTIIRFKDVDGNIFVWKKSGYFDEMDAGTKIILDGSVKKHEIYKDVKQTLLTRCKWDYSEEK